jgi:glycosyltransferase involved in cell wall biosynthesis
MQNSFPHETTPVVSIVLPTYNRAKFLPQAFDSIAQQTYTDWELIVVDDGSRDNTPEVIQELAPRLGRPVISIRQENAGPAEARNAGIERARGKYLAFFDSDDIWLPHHLQDCAAALDANTDMDWVFTTGRRVHYETKRVLIEHGFYDVQPRPRFLSLHCKRVGDLRIIDDPNILRCALRGGAFGGLQSCMVRREVFDGHSFQTVAFFEDALAIIKAIGRGVRIGYIDKVHVIVHTHGENISFASDKELQSRLKAMQTYVAALDALRYELSLSRKETRALNAKLAQEYFWRMGYLLVRRQRYKEALELMRQGLRYCPFNPLYWKTYFATQVKSAIASFRSLREEQLAKEPKVNRLVR